jgi:glycosyltransferase involved in cell wall biosynthesis
MKPQPLVTIVTPTYNRANYILETVASILEQGYPNLEYIVLDDGSTDDTLEVLQKYKSHIVLETHSNMGEAATVNKGFSMARGDIIAVVNSDDPLLPGAVNTMVEFMARYSQVGVAYPDWNMIDARGKIISHVQTWEYDYLAMLRQHYCIPGPGVFFRRSILEPLKGRDAKFRYVSDFDFWLRAGLLTSFARVSKTLATFRSHPDSASTNQVGRRMAQEHIALIDKIYSLPNLPTEVMSAKKEAFGSAYYIAGYVCEPGDLPARKQYFRKAILLSPVKYLTEYRRSRLLNIILPAFFPFLQKAIYKFKKIKRQLLHETPSV